MMGIDTGIWAKIDGDCSIEYITAAKEVEFRLGRNGSVFELIVTERGLEKLLAQGADALHALRVRQEQEEHLASHEM